MSSTDAQQPPNTAVALFRQNFPDDQRSDDEILRDVATVYPDLVNAIPDSAAAWQKLQQSDQPQSSALGAAGRGFLRNIFPAIATGAGALGAGALASETGPGAIPAAIVGGTAAGALARKLQNAIFGSDDDQAAADEAAHPIASNLGSFAGQIPSMLGAGGLGKKLAASLLERGVSEAAAIRLGALAENATAGAIMSGSSAAQAKVTGAPGSEDVSIPGAMIKGAVTMAPLSFIPQAASVLGAVGWKAPTDAAVMGLSNALYDHFVNGKDIDAKEVAKQAGIDLPGFVLVNALTSVLHLPFTPADKKATKITSESAGGLKEMEPTGPPIRQVPEPEIDPMINYPSIAPELKAKVDDVIARQAKGETGPAIESALNSIYAEPQMHRYYSEQMRQISDAGGQPNSDASVMGEKDKAASPAPTSSKPWWRQEQERIVGNLGQQKVSEIEALSAQRLTAHEVAQRLGLETAEVRAARALLGIPSMDMKTDFEDWLKNYQAKKSGQPAAATAPPLSRNPEVRVSDAQNASDAPTGRLEAARRAAATAETGQKETEIPDLSAKKLEALATKQPFELTKDEFIALRTKQLEERGRSLPADALAALHGKLVADAVQNGATVPERVLADYPGLKSTTSSTVSEPSQARTAPVVAQMPPGTADETASAMAAGKLPPMPTATPEVAAAQQIVADHPFLREEQNRDADAWKKQKAGSTDMTPEERARASGLRVNMVTEDKALSNHRRIVEQAIRDGRPVPENVLRDYHENTTKTTSDLSAPVSPKEPAKYVEGSSEQLLKSVDFEGARVVTGESGRGRKVAPAFIETSDAEELYKDASADRSRRNLSRKLGVFMSPDGSRVVIGTAYENGQGNAARKVTFLDANGNPKAIRFLKLTSEPPAGEGYELIAAMKTKDANAGYSLALPRSEWDALASELRLRATAAKSGGVSPVSENVAKEIIKGGQEQSGSVVSTPNASTHEWREASGQIEPQLATRLLESIGNWDWKNAKDAEVKILDGLTALPVGDQEAILKAFSPRDSRSGEIDMLSGLNRLTDTIYEKYAAGKTKQRVVAEIGQRDNGNGAPSTEAAPSDAQAERGEGSAGPAVGNAAPGSERGVGGQNEVRLRAGEGARSGAQRNAPDAANGQLRFADLENGPGGAALATAAHVSAVWNQTLKAAATNGLDVRVLAGLHEGGVYSPRTIALTVADPLNPSLDNLTLAIHEVGHDVYTQLGLPDGKLDAFHRAIEKLSTPEGFTPKLVEGVNVRQVTAEETLVERAARNLVAEGFEPANARGIVSQLVRVLKDLYYRAAIGIQASLFGADHVSPELAQRYFENRLRQYLAGSLSPTSILSFLGGAFPRTEQRGELFVQRGGEGTPVGVFNFDSGTMEYQQALPQTMEALRFNSEVSQAAHILTRLSERGSSEQDLRNLANVRVTDPHVISRDLNSPAKVEIDVAAYNALHDFEMAAFKIFNDAGMNTSKLTFEQFLQQFTNSDGPATEKINARNAELVATAKDAGLNWSPVDPQTRIDSLTADTSQMQAADTAYRYLWSRRQYLSQTRLESERTLTGSEERLARQNELLGELVKNRTDADLYLEAAKRRISSAMATLKNSVRSVGATSEKAGVITQLIGELEGKVNQKLLAQYDKALQGIYSTIEGDSDAAMSFTDSLERVAQLGLDWKTESAADIRDTIRLAFSNTHDPLLRPFLDDSPKGKAMLAIALAFGKQDALAMDLLSVRRSRAIDELRQIDDALKKGFENHDNAIEDAKATIQKLPTLQATADRIISELGEMKARNFAELESQRRAKVFIEFHDKVRPGLTSRMIQLEQMLGARSMSWEANHGSEYPVAPNPKASADAVMANLKTLKLTDIDSNAELVQHIEQNTAWLNAQAADKRGADWQTVNMITQKLKDTIGVAEYELSIRQNAINTFFGSVSDKMDSTGLPALRSAATRIRRYVAERHASHAEADNLGVTWNAAAERAKRALGLKNVDNRTFEDLFYQSAKSFAEKNSDLRAGFKTDKEAFDALMPRLRKYLESDPDLRERMRRPGAWTALEAYYRQTFVCEQWTKALSQKLGGKVQEVLPDGSVFYRDPIGSTFFTGMRVISKATERLYHSMRKIGWLGTDSEGGKLLGDPQRIAENYSENRDLLSARVQALMTPDIERNFTREIATGMEGRSAFYSVQRADDITPLASREHVARAYEAAGGDLVQFAENLYDLEDAATRDGAESRDTFVGKTLHTFQQFFDNLHGQFGEQDDQLRNGMPVPPRLLLDARVSEALPGAWLKYRTYSRYDMQQITHLLASQAAFGSKMEAVRRDFQTGITDLAAKTGKFNDITKQVRLANLDKKGEALQKAIRAEVERRGENYTTLSQAARNLEMVRAENRRFDALMKLGGGLALEVRPFMELVSAAAGATVQSYTTGMMQLADFGQAFQKLGIGPTALRVMKQSAKSFAAEKLGTLAQLFHQQIGWNADRNARRVRAGIFDPDAQRRFSDARLGLIHDTTSAENATSRAAFRLARGIRLATSSGFGRAEEGAENIYTTFKPHAPFSQNMFQMNLSLIDGWVGGAFEDMVERAVRYFQDPTHAGDLANPSFRFTDLKDLGYNKGILGLFSDERAFKYLTNSLARYGIDLETQARDVLRLRAKDSTTPAITDDQFRRLASIVPNEITLESNPTNRPSAMYTNPVLRMAAPLMTWAIAKSHDSWESFRNPDMTQTSTNAFKAFRTGMTPYLALVPIALALSILRDKFEQKVLQKKADRHPADTFAGMVEALGWVGTFGIWGDIANATINSDTQRPFSVDNRVYFLSSMRSAVNALENWYQQGSADYSTVYRPLIAALGGSGYLQQAQAINGIVSQFGGEPPFTQEARVTARLSAANYLRVFGREMKLDVRTSSGGDTVSNPMRPLLGEMLMAALSNDHEAFQEAYHRALNTAQIEKGTRQAAMDYVQNAFAAYNPLRTVFRVEPTMMQYQKLVSSLPDDGKQAVDGALRLYNSYAVQVINSKGTGIKPNFGRPNQPTTTQLLSPADLNAVRRAAYGTPLSSPLSLDEIRRRAMAF